MFNATIAGTIKRVIHDNDKDKEKAMIKIVIESRKSFVRDGDMPNIYPVVTIWGHDAGYVRDFAGPGHWITVYNAEHESYRGEDGDEEEKISYRAGRVEILPKKMAEAVASTIEDDDEDEPRRKKKKASAGRDTKRTKSRSERRRGRDEEDEDEDEDEEEEETPRRKSKTKSKPAAKKSSSKKPVKKKPVVEDDDDEDYDDEDYYDDDEDEFFDEDED